MLVGAICLYPIIPVYISIKLGEGGWGGDAEQRGGVVERRVHTLPVAMQALLHKLHS